MATFEKRLPRRAVAWLATVGAAALLHELCGRYVAGHDLIVTLMSGRDSGVVPAAAGLVAARMFLVFLAPGWALHIAVRALLERRLARPTEAPSGPG